MAHDPANLAVDQPAADWIPPGYAGPIQLENYTGPAATDWNDEHVTGATIQIMARLATEDATSDVIRAAAADVMQTAQLAGGADRQSAIARAAWHYVDRQVIFVGDEVAIEPFDFFFPPDELLIRPSALLSMPRPRDDCDGFSMLLVSILTACGVESSFVTIAANRQQPRRYSHVYVIAHTPSGKIPLDASHGPAPGYEHHPQYKRKEWPIKKMIHPAQQRALSGIGAFDWTALTTGVTDLAKGILIPRYGTPAAGTQAQYDERGQLRQVSTFPGGGATLSGGSTTTIVLIAAVAFIGVMAMSAGRRGPA